MDKTTWIWFLPHPKADGIATRDEKIKAIEQCLIEKFPNCNKIEKTISYDRKENCMRLPPQTGLIVIIDRVNDLFSALYEELLFSYKLRKNNLVWGDETFFSTYNRTEKPINRNLKIPEELNIKDYIPKVKGLKLEQLKDNIELTSSRIISLIRREGVIDDSLVTEELGVPLNMVSTYMKYLLSKKMVVEGVGFIRDTYKRVKLFTLPGVKSYEKSSKRYEYVNF